MPRRAVLSEEQRAALLALPDEETLLVQHWTLSQDDLTVIVRRRRPHNRLGFAIQLCALRYPGRLLRPGELIPHAPLAFVAEQLKVASEALADYAMRGSTRYEQLDALRDAFGFTPLSRPLRATLQEWLLPVALTTTSGARLARLLLDECRRRRIIVPGISAVERMVAQALLDAERHVAEHLTRGLSAEQRRLLDALLLSHPGTNLSGLSWVRQPPGKPGRKMFATIIERLTLLRAIGIDPGIAASVHPERLRRLCQEGARLTAQHVRTLQTSRRRATLVATVLESVVTLTDDAVLMFDRLLGQMFRREQNSEDAALKRDRRTINGKIRLLAQLGDALLAARMSGGDIGAAVVEGAAVWMQYATAYGALVELGKVGPGDFVLITAASSSVGLAAIQIAKAEGAIAIATTRTSSKKAQLLELGADHVIVTEKEDLLARVTEITGGKMARIVFDPVAGDYVEVLAQATAYEGKIFLYGMLSGQPTMYPASGIWKAVSLAFYLLDQTKTPERLARMKSYIYQHLADGTFKPQVDRIFPFSEVVEAYKYLESNQQVGKIVITI